MQALAAANCEAQPNRAACVRRGRPREAAIRHGGLRQLRSVPGTGESARSRPQDQHASGLRARGEGSASDLVPLPLAVPVDPCPGGGPLHFFCSAPRCHAAAFGSHWLRQCVWKLVKRPRGECSRQRLAVKMEEARRTARKFKPQGPRMRSTGRASGTPLHHY
jgi:hypothetical protein